ncbi:hypothetical protein L6R53_33005 [Myxococcota bacterium]|nr:hypothetical protein [Myxococcota bacterium]
MIPLLLATGLALADAPAPASVPDPVQAHHARHHALRRRGMAVLGGWSAVNLVGGGVGAALAEQEQWRWFHLGNLGWNTVNAALAAGGLLAPSRPARDRADAVRQQQAIEEVLLFNAGLDLAYMTAGAWLWDRGERLDDPRQLGLGQALVLQGGFLLGFDLGLYEVLRRHDRALLVAPLAGEEQLGLLVTGRW